MKVRYPVVPLARLHCKHHYFSSFFRVQTDHEEPPFPKPKPRIMQWVLTTWTNDECTTILALPDGGKLVACEPVVPEQTDTTTRTRALLENDIFVMTTYRTQGRERSEEEFRHL